MLQNLKNIKGGNYVMSFNQFSKSHHDFGSTGTPFIKILFGWLFGNLLAALLILTVCSIFGGFLWPYAINAWLIHFGMSAKVTFLHGMVLGFIPGLCFIQFPLSALTWVVMACI